MATDPVWLVCEPSDLPQIGGSGIWAKSNGKKYSFPQGNMPGSEKHAGTVKKYTCGLTEKATSGGGSKETYWAHFSWGREVGLGVTLDFDRRGKDCLLLSDLESGSGIWKKRRARAWRGMPWTSPPPPLAPAWSYGSGGNGTRSVSRFVAFSFDCPRPGVAMKTNNTFLSKIRLPLLTHTGKAFAA